MSISVDLKEILMPVYRAALHSDQWDTALKALVKEFSVESALLISESSDSGHAIYAEYNIDPYWLNLYHDYYYKFDPSIELFSRHPGKVIPDHVTGLGRDHLPPDRQVFYHEVMRPQKYFHTAGCALALPGGRYHGLILTRTRGQGAFSRSELRLLGKIASHASESLKLAHELHHQKLIDSAFSNILNRANLGVVLLDNSGRPIFANDVARAVFHKTRAVDLSAETISASRHAENSQLQELIRNCLGIAKGWANSGGAMLASGRNGEQIPIRVVPMEMAETDGMLGQSVAVAIFCKEPRQLSGISAQTLRQIFDLTQAESEIAIAAANGLGVRDMARGRGCSDHTVRAQLKSIFNKTQTHRQSELVRLVLSNVLLGE